MYGLSAKKVAVVERFKQKSMYGLSTKKMAVVERRPLVEVGLYVVYFILVKSNWWSIINAAF